MHPEATIRRYELGFALDGWRGGQSGAETTYRYEAAQGLVFSLLRHVDPAAAIAFHDMNERKALSISPVAIQPLAGGLARAEIQLAVWEQSLVRLVDAGLRGATDARLRLGKAPAVLLAWRQSAGWTAADLLGAPAMSQVRVRFDSPTLFGFGRHPNGKTRTQIVPDPGPVVASWLRAWKLTGDRSLDWLPTSPEELGAAIALVEIRDVRTVVVTEATARLPGFVGECVYRWEGREEAGRQALTALARFADFSGTGAKTGRGFGQTRFLDESAAAPACSSRRSQGATR